MTYKSLLQSRILELDLAHAIKWLGPIYPWEQNVNTYYMADIVVSLATTDGSPSSVIEAMACGVPVIGGDIPPLREWIVPGFNGLLIPPRDAKALAEAIITLLQNPQLRHEFSQRNLQLVKEQADYHKEMQKMENLYQSLLHHP